MGELVYSVIHDRSSAWLVPHDVLDQPCPAIVVAGGAAHHHFKVHEAEGLEPHVPEQNGSKPPYAIPSMQIIKHVPLNGFKFASTFSGTGGSCLGFRWAGFQPVYACEFVDVARQSYAANFEFEPDGHDVREVTGDSVRAFAEMHGLGPGEELDLLEGSPPCDPFSTAGKREARWGSSHKYGEKKEQRTDDLFFEFSRLLSELRPKMFVAENVSGLVRGVAKGYFKEIHKALSDCGYVVKARLLDAQWLGVPQMRRRVIFIGVRKDFKLEPRFPKPLSYNYSVRDALPHVARVKGRTALGFKVETYELDDPMKTVLTASQTFEVLDAGPPRPWKDNPKKARKVSLDKPSPTILQGDRGRVQMQLEQGKDELSIERFAIGKEWHKTPMGKASKKFFSLKRPDPDKPSQSMTAGLGIMGAAGVVHPTEPRRFTIPELKRLSGFPDDFILEGTYGQQWERLGMCVPPPMAYHVALAVREVLEAINSRG